MPSTPELALRFIDLHQKGRPLLLANVWDVGSARALASLGFAALATTSQGHAGTLGRRDGCVTRDEALRHASEIVCATPLPVNADLEQGFGDSPDDVARTVRGATETGLAGCSIEDWAGPEGGLYAPDAARARIEAAAEAASDRLVLTARSENYLRGRPDLADTIARLQAFQEAGADVLYAPGLADADEIRQVVASVDRPVNVLARLDGPDVAGLADLGVARISVGSAFYLAGLSAITDAAREWIDKGTHGFWKDAARGMKLAHEVFQDERD